MATISMNTPLVMRNNAAYVSETSISANTKTALEWKEDDNKMILVINASGTVNLTVFAGNGIQGAADLNLYLGPGISLIKLESGRFKNVSGVNKGKIFVQFDSTVSAGIVALV